jgi:hypothetical protein
MKFVETSQQKSLDFTVEQLTKLIGEYEAKIEEVKGNQVFWDAEVNDTEEDMEVDTVSGKVVCGPGDYILSSGAKKMVVLKEMMNNEELWLAVEDSE